MKSSVLETSVYPGVGEWFLRSGIQEANGGVARYHFSDVLRNAPVSSEITGYCVSTLVDLYRQTAQPVYLEAALKAAHFLVATAWRNECSAMQFECKPDTVRYSYFFDVGIIIRGLLTLWRECGHAELLSAALKCGESMAKDFFDGQEFSPIIELPAKTALPYQLARWSKSPGCYQLKAAMAWYELWQIGRQDHFLTLYERLLDSSLASHESFLPGIEDEIPVMDRLHAYSYFLEGLLPAITQPGCADTLASGIERVAYYMDAISNIFLRSDVVAQLLRIRLFADALGVVPLDESAAGEEAATLRHFQSQDADPRLRGGFWFGEKVGETLPYMNPVSTAFCYQALQMWNRYQRGDLQLAWQQLI
jgi:hypothetical protein